MVRLGDCNDASVMTQIAFEFHAVRSKRGRDVVAFAEALPRLCRGALEECDIGTATSSATFLLVARFRGPISEPVVARLAFWASRLAGSMSPAEGAAPAGESSIRSCETVLCRVSPGLLHSAASHLLRRLGGIGSDRDEGGLCLSLSLGAPESAGISFERRRGALFVPSPCSPPLGDRIQVRLRSPDGDTLEMEGAVTAVRADGEDGPGAPAGFILGLSIPTDRVLEALEAHAGPLSVAGRRRFPRYPVRARATVCVDAGRKGHDGKAVARLAYANYADLARDYVENLSQGGAFVRTQTHLATGTPIRLDLELPGGRTVSVRGVVAHRNDRGVGIRFELDQAGEAEIAEAIASLAPPRRRALVIDDDLLARRMLGDALAGRGFEVLAAEDGAAGLRVLSEELLGLDLLVTDLRMPSIDGEQLLRLIRQAGGERDLAVLVVTSDLDADLEQRLVAAGADAVIAKGPNMALAGEVAEAVILQRRKAAPPPYGVAHPA